jgi:hypothetical protein
MDNVLPDIFNTDIVSAAFDVFWEDERMKQFGPKDNLVISLPFASGSVADIQLNKLLAACKLSAEQYHIIQLAPDEEIAWHLLKSSTQATKVMLLGVLPAQLGIAAMMLANEVNQFDGAQWMPSLSLDQIAQNDALKKQLWVNVFQKVYF